MSKANRPTIRNFTDFVEEAGMLPDGREPDINITNSLERWFVNVADKHGVLDEILDGDEE